MLVLEGEWKFYCTATSCESILGLVLSSLSPVKLSAKPMKPPFPGLFFAQIFNMGSPAGKHLQIVLRCLRVKS